MPDIPALSFLVGRDSDRFGQCHSLGASTFSFKVSTEDTHGALLVFELINHAKGGPARHLHYEQDEWIYVLEGKYVVEVGQDRFELNPGDSAFSSRRVPHVWACVGEQPGRIVFALTPAGRLEAFFREIFKGKTMAPQDPALWRAYGLELVGPPLAL